MNVKRWVGVHARKISRALDVRTFVQAHTTNVVKHTHHNQCCEAWQHWLCVPAWWNKITMYNYRNKWYFGTVGVMQMSYNILKLCHAHLEGRPKAGAKIWAVCSARSLPLWRTVAASCPLCCCVHACESGCDKFKIIRKRMMSRGWCQCDEGLRRRGSGRGRGN